MESGGALNDPSPNQLGLELTGFRVASAESPGDVTAVRSDSLPALLAVQLRPSSRGRRAVARAALGVCGSSQIFAPFL